MNDGPTIKAFAKNVHLEKNKTKKIGFMKIRVQYLKKEIKKLTLKERKDALRSASEEIFKMVDLDNSGQLDESEFFSVLKSMNKTHVEIKNIKRKLVMDSITDEDLADFTDDELKEHIESEVLPAMSKDDMARYFVEQEDPTKISLWWWKKSSILQTRSLLLQFSLLIHTPLSRRLIEYFHCNKAMVDNESYLIADYRIKCFDGDYFTFLGFVIPIVLFLTIGLPFGIALYLWRHRKELNSPDIVVQVGFIYSAYKQGSEFWEMHEILRKILLTSAILFYQSEPSLQAGIAIGICFMGECMLNYFQPQKNRNLFWLAQISFFFTGVKFGFSFLINGVWGKLRAKSLGTTLICLDCVILVASIVLILYSFKKIPKKDKTKKSNISNLQIVPSSDGDEFTGGRKIEAKLKVKTEEELKEDICDLLLSYYGDKSFEYKQGKSLMEEYDDLDEDEFKGEMKAFLEDMGDKDKAKEEFTNLCHQLMYR
jgi:hypothetical protein